MPEPIKKPPIRNTMAGAKAPCRQRRQFLTQLPFNHSPFSRQRDLLLLILRGIIPLLDGDLLSV